MQQISKFSPPVDLQFLTRSSFFSFRTIMAFLRNSTGLGERASAKIMLHASQYRGQDLQGTVAPCVRDLPISLVPTHAYVSGTKATIKIHWIPAQMMRTYYFGVSHRFLVVSKELTNDQRQSANWFMKPPIKGPTSGPIN